MLHLKRFVAFLIIFIALIFVLPKDIVNAAGIHNIMLLSADGTKISVLKIDEGGSLGELPEMNNLLVWIDEHGNTITNETIPISDMKVTAVTKEDVLSYGTLDNDKLLWFILDGHLYVTGTGTIGIIPEYKSTGSTKKYGLSIGDIEVEHPAIAYDWLYKPSVGDEQTTGYGAFYTPSSDLNTVSLNISRPVSITEQTIGYPHSTMDNYIPWKADASQIISITFAETVSLNGNFTLYFNANSSSVTPSELNESIYSNLENIYMFADTTNVVQMGGMYARIPKLKGIYTLSGNTYNTGNCWDMSGMFYGNEYFTCETKTLDNNKLTSIINVFSDVSKVKDMRYMLFGCKNLKQPAIGNWNTTSLQDTSYMAAGCTNLQLTLEGTNTSYDLGKWDMSNVYSATGMFAGANIDLKAENPLANLWGITDSKVITGKINLDLWNFSELQVSVFMFAQNPYITNINWTTEAPVLKDASAMFAFCNRMKTIDFSELKTPSLNYIDVIFFCSGEKDGTADLSDMNLTGLKEARYAFYGTGLKKIDFNNTNPSLLQNAEGMFSQNKNLVSLGTEALSGWNLPKLTDASFMFYNCGDLTSLKLNNWDMRNVKTVAYMFALCTSLTDTGIGSWKIESALENLDCFMYENAGVKNLDLSLWNAKGVSSAFMSFAKMSELINADISGIKFELLTNTNGMFAYDTSLKKLITGEQKGSSLLDASGMFYGCQNLMSAEIKNLITSVTKNISYICSGVSTMQTMDISGWNTTGVDYMQCAFDGMTALTAVEIGQEFSTVSAKTTAALLRNCMNLSDASLQKIILSWNPAVTESINAMFKNTEKLCSLNLSGKDFSSVTNYTNAFSGNSVLTNIILPDNFFSGIENNSSGMQNVFYVPEQTVTYLTVDTTAATVPNKLASYSWNTDNRKFMLEKDAYIVDAKNPDLRLSNTVYTFTESGQESICMNYDIISTFFIAEKELPIAYVWKNNGTIIPAADESKHSIFRGTTGTFTVTASLPVLKNSELNSKEFHIQQASNITGINATYNGEPVLVNTEYSLDNLAVNMILSDGSYLPVEKNNFQVEQQMVTSIGENTFNVYYTDIDKNIWSATFTVQGYRPIASIEATYTGEPIEVGNKYSAEDVSVYAYYIDDINKTQGFQVTPTTFSSFSVNTVGDNTFTVYYTDLENQNAEFMDTFVVSGYTKKTISSISAIYKGDKITVGSCYDKKDVDVIINYSDNSTETVTSFSVNSLFVKDIGPNSFVITYIDPSGNIYNADFSVEGINVPVSYIKASYTGKNIQIGNSYNIEDVLVTAYYTNGTSRKTDSFTVNSTKVTEIGKNTYTASFTDSSGKVFTVDFDVNGYSLSKVESIEASYQGSDIPVGQTYDIKNVIVIIKFIDEKSDFVTTDFTVNSTSVTKSGPNTFTAYVSDSNGNIFSDSFLVNGIADRNENVQTDSNLGVQTGESNNLLGVIFCLLGFILLFIVLLYCIIKIRKKGVQ